MADKTISREKLRELSNDGADVEFDPKSVSIEQFGELIDAVKQMAANEAQRIKADISRNQANLEIIGTLQSMIRKAGQAPTPEVIDLSPIRDLINEMRTERTHNPADYDFKIVRSGGDGFQPAVRIEARCVKTATKH